MHAIELCKVCTATSHCVILMNPGRAQPPAITDQEHNDAHGKTAAHPSRSLAR